VGVTKIFKNDKQITNFFTSEMKLILDEVAEKIILELQKKIDEKVYNGFTPTTYSRQMDNGGLRDLWQAKPSKKRGDTVKVKIEEEPDLMTHDPDNFIHGSNYWTKNDIRDILSNIVIEGKSGDLFGDGEWRQPRDFWTPLIDMLDSGEINKMLESGFKSRGINFIRIS